MKLQEFAVWVREQLALVKIQCTDPKLHSQQIIEAFYGWKPGDFYLHQEEPLSESDKGRIVKWVERRKSGEPFQYIVGYEWFWKSKFAVGPGVLIPRRETEHLVEELLQEKLETAHIIELGAGTGNIGISVLLERPKWHWLAFEKNSDSISYLRKNLELLPWGAEYLFQQADFFEALNRPQQYDFIVSNPPYVSSNEIATLSPEVQSEPRLALDGGADGTDILLQLLDAGTKLLKPGGKIFFEMGHGQQERMEKALKEKGYSAYFLKDYSGIPRVGKGTLNGRTTD